MIAAENLQYQNVFIGNTLEYTSFSTAILLILISPLIGGVLLSVFTSTLARSISIFFTVLAFLIAPALYSSWTVRNSNTTIENIHHNVNQKYGLEINLDVDDLRAIKDLSELNRYTALVRSEQLRNEYVRVPYAISFDKVTNEPTLEEIEPVKIPAASDIANSEK
jgi:hypothetical protein